MRQNARLPLKGRAIFTFCAALLCVGGVLLAQTQAAIWIMPPFFDGGPRNFIAVDKITELPSSTSPKNQSSWCERRLVRNAVGVVQSMCTWRSPLGTLTDDHRLVTGDTATASLSGPSDGSWFLPVMNPDIALLATPAPAGGQYVGVYKKGVLKRSDMRYDIGRRGYVIQKEPGYITDGSGQRRVFDTDKLAYSSNGSWLAMPVPGKGIMRFDTDGLEGGLLLGSYKYDMAAPVAAQALAVSNEGNQVAIAAHDERGELVMWVYLVGDYYNRDGCLEGAPSYLESCVATELWQASDRTSQELSYPAVMPQAEQRGFAIRDVANLRFINYGALGFDAVYDRTNPQNYYAASFSVYVESYQRYIGMLGLGDSYSSGEGTFDYRPETDTANNRCHTSTKSYQYLLGEKYYDSYASVACSGAMMRDITDGSTGYKGQVKDAIPKDKRDDNDK